MSRFHNRVVSRKKWTNHNRLFSSHSVAGFRKANMRAFVYSSCHVYCNKMRAYALYGIQPVISPFLTFATYDFVEPV